MKYSLGLNGKNVLITGAAGGIGLECVKGFLENGAAVFLCDLDENVLAEACRTLGESYPGARVAYAVCDVTKEADIENALDAAEKEFGSIDVLVNNAGIAHDVYSIFETRADWSRVLDINLTG